MSFKNLGNKQTIVLHNCEIDNKKYDLVISPHTQTVGYIRIKRQTLKRKIINKQRQTTRKRFSKNRNTFSKSEASNLDELYKLKESIDKNCHIHDQLCFSDSETTSNSSKRRKRRIKKQYKHKPIHLYNWNQPYRHIDTYILTVITEQSDYIWDPEWSHPTFINIPQSISSQAISTISYHRDYVKVIPLTIDATPLNYNTFLPDTRNNSLNSTVIYDENLNGTRNLTQQDIQTPSHFINEEIFQTTTTTQQSISPIHPNLTTPRNTSSSLAQVTLQSTVKPSVAPKYSHMDYQTFRPMTEPSKPRKTFTRNTFAEHNYNYAHSLKANYPPRKNNHNVCSQY